MTFSRFDWQEHIKDVEREHKAARFAIDRLRAQVQVSPDILTGDGPTRKYLGKTVENLEGTYLVRLFAAFEAALRSFDRARHNDPTRNRVAAALIDSTASHKKIAERVLAGAHAVRLVRNYWAHEADDMPEPLTLAQARSHLERFLTWLPNEWD